MSGLVPADTQGFEKRAAIVAKTSDKNLMVIHGENFSQRDCCSNSSIMTCLFTAKFDPLDTTLSCGTTWIQAFKQFDRNHNGKLSKCNGESTRNGWAKAEHYNLRGVVQYFGSKLAKNKGSHNDQIKDLKLAFFDMPSNQQEAAEVTVIEVAAATTPRAALTGLAYPEESDMEEGGDLIATRKGQQKLDGHLVVVPFPSVLSPANSEVSAVPLAKPSPSSSEVVVLSDSEDDVGPRPHTGSYGFLAEATTDAGMTAAPSFVSDALASASELGQRT